MRLQLVIQISGKIINNRIMQQSVKLIVVGDSGVGRSSIFTRFSEDKFPEEFQTTIGLDFVRNKVDRKQRQCLLKAGGVECRYGIRLARKGIALLHITTKETHMEHYWFSTSPLQGFLSLPFYIQELQHYPQLNSNTILIGNKSDLTMQRMVSDQEIDIFANKHNLKYIECSAYSSFNIEMAFHVVLREVLSGRWEETNEQEVEYKVFVRRQQEVKRHAAE